ncbi:MAG: histidine kinase N-terminal 7TM domain-containing protein, partial [Halobacteriota archaeon]
MNVLLVAHAAVFTAAALVCLAALPRALAIQHPGTREGLVGLLVSVTLWSAGYLGYLLAPTQALQLASYIFGFVFAFVAVGAWLYFCAAYTGRTPRQAPYRRALVAVFLVFSALKVTNPIHEWYFTTEWVTTPFPHLAIQHELLYWIVLGLSYAAIAIGFFMVLERFYHTGTDSRPLIALLAITAVPAAATIVGDQVDFLLPLMYEPPGVAVFAAGTLFVYSRRFEAVRVTGTSEKPSIFLDPDSRVRDFNPAASTAFPELAGSIGELIDSVFPDVESRLTDDEIVTVDRGGDTRFYELQRTPFLSGEVQTGQLVTVVDVTDRETYRQRLETKSEQLEALNRVVRHDIRNDMAVVLGWAEYLRDHVDEDGDEPLEGILAKSEHVIELTDVSREFIESLSDDGIAEPRPIDLRATIESELVAVRESHPEATFEVSGGLPSSTVAATQMLSSVFRNILENAVRHNDTAAPAVTIHGTESAGSVRVTVADNGPGVPDDRKETIFGKGEKGLDSAGSGIGLYLVRTLVT